MRLLPLLPLLLLGCRKNRTPEIDGTCSDSAEEAGAAGAVSLDRQDLDWTWYRKGDLSWAGPVEFILGDDITSFAITIDGGDEPTGIAWLANDGKAVLDGAADAVWGDPVRSAAMAATDTWAWDSGDTADSGWVPDGYGWGSDPLYHYPEAAGTVRLPLNSDTEPRPGCLRFVAVVKGDREGKQGEALLVTKRSPATADKLNVNLILMEGSGITEEQAWEAADEMFRIYDSGDALSVGTVEMWLDVIGGGAPKGASGGPEAQELRSRNYGGDFAMNIFFISDFKGESGTLGIAAGIPGPMGVQNTAGSGVLISVDTHLDGGGQLDVPLMGGTMAHELGHQLGLFHSTEAEGTAHDIIADTPECTAKKYDSDGDGWVTAEECVDADGANFMFWTSGDLVQEDISTQQAAMLDASPPAQ